MLFNRLYRDEADTTSGTPAPTADTPAVPAVTPTPPPITDDWGEVVVSTKYKEIKVTVVDETKNTKGEDRKPGEDPQKLRFIMRELGGDRRDNYLTANNKKAELCADGFLRTTNFEGSTADLLSLMMFQVQNIDGVDKVSDMPYPKTKIQAWPSSVSLFLYKRAMEISGLRDDAVEQAKNG